ncbi:phosphoribosylaminoimidazole carboxylase [Priestia megaterium]|uniref:AbaSI family restriction endonuclease n=1 Tax=Priestia megaterium TaxID=1404 RepID=UPI002E1F15F4|nr:phosphoribosylaminoimidazole carboxylase [Priestia megaterium]
MNKYEYVKRQLAKTNKKNDENYIITRIWHLLNNYDIKINTQQYVVRPDNNQSTKYGLIDLYFPQFKLAIEIDEAHHKNEVNQTLDQIRKNDIVIALDCEFIRIDATQSIEEIHKKIDQVVRKINLLKDENGFIPWDIDKEYNPTTYIEQGYIDADDNISLKTVADCCNVFGAGYNNGYQQSGAPHKFEENTDIKRLNFFPNKEWNNKLHNNEDVFTEYSTDQIRNEDYFNKRMFERNQRTALFAYSKTSTGNFEAVFKGLYVLNREESKKTGVLTYNRISKIMPTYYPSNVTQPVKIAEAYNEDGYKVAHFYTEDQIKKFNEKYCDEYKLVKTTTKYHIQ